MGCFEDRKMFYSKACNHCVHSLIIPMDYDGETYNEYFCMLGMSSENKDYVTKEIYNNEERYGDSTYLWDITPKFLEIMRMDEGQILPNSPRHVGSHGCCQFYKEYE